MKIELNKCYCCDCNDFMQLMIEQGIKADWCITDPPYGIGYASKASEVGGTQFGTACSKKREYTHKDWDEQRIGESTIKLMRQVSNEQIIFGGNYYTDYLPPTKSWVVWDKRSGNDSRLDFGDCELAWCSTDVARVFRYLYNGMIQGDMKNKDYRWHASQKPTQLWYMILNWYTKEGDLIFDPFAGSQSLRIACHRLKRNYIGCEIDPEYFEKGNKWVERETAQMSIFDL